MARQNYAPRRRYKIGENPEYDSTFDWLKSHSAIFNPANVSYEAAWIADAIQTKDGIKIILATWKGDESGHFIKNKILYNSFIKEAENALEEINQRFKIHKQKMINEGRKSPSKMPPDLKKDRLRAEAKFDVIQSEIAHLERKLSIFQESESEKTEKAVLKGGPQGHGKIQGGILVEIDGQRIVKDPKGVLRMKDHRSPYNGMTASDYTEHIVRPFQMSKLKLDKENREKAKEAARKGIDPKTLKFTKNPPRPEWPENVEHYEWEELIR